MNYKYTVIAIVAFLLVIQSALACTVIVGNNGSKTLVGANEDYYYEKPYLWFTKTTNKNYGCAFFGYSFVNDFGIVKMRIPGKFSPQQAVNEKGLFFDNLATPHHEILKTAEMKNASYQAIKRMMKTCASVEEAIDFLKTHHLKYLNTAKILLADKTGNYVIYDGDDFIRKAEENYCVSTNFLENNKEKGNYPCPRFTKAEELFVENNQVSVSNFTTILKAVHQNDDNLKGGTMYSLVCDLKTGEINLFQFQDYEHKYMLNIHNELKKGTKKIIFEDSFKKRSFPILFEVLTKKGADEAMIRFEKLRNDNKYNKSESELIFFSKALYNLKHYKYADVIIKLCLNEYPRSESAMEMMTKTSLMNGSIEELINFYKNKESIDREFANLLSQESIEDAIDFFHKKKKEKDRVLFSESTLNKIGYGYITLNKVSISIELFKLNVEVYPKSSNTYDSLGEAYLLNGDITLAIKYYQKSLELNSNNTNAKEMIKELEKHHPKQNVNGY